MKGIRQHPKAFVFVSLFGLALIVTTVFGAASGGTFNSDVYSGAWEVSVYNFSYNSATQRTSSTH